QPPFGGRNVTPYQNQLNNSQQDSGMAAALRTSGMAAIAAGAAMLMAGMSPPNVKMIMAGLSLLLGGFGMLGKAAELGNRAMNGANDIATQYGQLQQAAIMQNCISQAVNNGTQVSNCQSNFQMPSDNVRQ